MPIYSFMAQDGEALELYFVAGEAPSLGAWVEIEGKLFQRTIEMPQVASSKGTQNYRLHSEALPNERQVVHWEREAMAKGLPMPARAPRYDDVGRPTFRSERELREYCKRDGRYSVGNPKEVAQEHVAKTAVIRRDALARVAENNRLANLPEVK